MKIYRILSRSGLLSLALILASAVLILSEIASSSIYSIAGGDNSQRVFFLSSVGCVVKEEYISKKETTIPVNFSTVYENYNKLQQKAGFDLSPYKGCAVTIYKYKVLSFSAAKGADCEANIIVYGGKIIGGDISSVSLDGFMLPLKK